MNDDYSAKSLAPISRASERLSQELLEARDEELARRAHPWADPRASVVIILILSAALWAASWGIIALSAAYATRPL